MNKVSSKEKQEKKIFRILICLIPIALISSIVGGHTGFG